MLHVTTEVGKGGFNEREKRHYPELHNRLGVLPQYKPRGRRYIPHGHGMYDEWKPHPQHIAPQLTESGPDWKSRLKYIEDPQNPKYPAAEIFENNWKAMRPYPSDIFVIRLTRKGRLEADTYKRTDNEWLLDPGLSNRGMKCNFNGEHMATRTSSDEITHRMLFGRGRNSVVIDKRNGIGESTPGDKAYHIPEYSPSFHKAGSSLPVIEFGQEKVIVKRPYEEACPKMFKIYFEESANSPWKSKPDTFVPLQPMPAVPREPYKVKARRDEAEMDRKTVKALDDWKPATPLKPEKVDDKK